MANEIPYEKMGALAKLFLPIVEKWGTKFLLALVIVCGVGWFVYLGKVDGLYGMIGMVVTGVVYSVMRDKQEKRDVK